jgi:hypothetical protein
MSIKLIDQVIVKLKKYNFTLANDSNFFFNWIEENISTPTSENMSMSTSVDGEYNKFMQNYQKLNPNTQTNFIFTIVYAICKSENKMQLFDTFFRLVDN